MDDCCGEFEVVLMKQNIIGHTGERRQMIIVARKSRQRLEILIIALRIFESNIIHKLIKQRRLHQCVCDKFSETSDTKLLFSISMLTPRPTTGTSN